MTNDCTPFDVTFTGTKDDLFEKMKNAANDKKLTLVITENNATSGTILIKKKIIVLVTVAAGNYEIKGQIITITVTQLPPKQTCEDVKDSIIKFINPPTPVS